jgi:hypothetical protein
MQLNDVTESQKLSPYCAAWIVQLVYRLGYEADHWSSIPGKAGVLFSTYHNQTGSVAQQSPIP